MLQLANILQMVVHRLDDGPLAQVNLIADVHQAILHVLAGLGNQMYPVDEQLLKQALADVPFVTEQLPEDFVVKGFLFQGHPVVHVALGEHKLEDLPTVVDDQVQFEPVKPAHGAVPLSGNSLEPPVDALSADMAYPNGCGVNV